MKKSLFIICLSFMLFPFGAEAQSKSSVDDNEKRVFSRKEVLQNTGFSLGVNLLLVNEISALDSVDIAELNIPWWMYTTMGAHHLPLYRLDAKKAGAYTLSDTAFLGAHLATKEWPYISYVPFHFFLYNEFYSTYEIYKGTRSNARSGIYPEQWKTYNRKELMLAPFKLENITRRFFYVTMLATTALNVIEAMGSKDAIWNTGDAYIDNKKVPISQAVPSMLGTNLLKYTATAVGEEALYRGVIYEEMKVMWGSKRAKIIDMIFFPAIHIPGDIARNKSSEDIINQFIVRSVSTLLFDHAYDRGGLPLSTALHMWFNSLSISTEWASNNGIQNPDLDNDSSSSIIPPLSLGFSISF